MKTSRHNSVHVVEALVPPDQTVNSVGTTGPTVLPKLAPRVTMLVANAASAWITVAVASIVRPSRLTDVT